jgi:hypothetical protein
MYHLGGGFSRLFAGYYNNFHLLQGDHFPHLTREELEAEEAAARALMDEEDDGHGPSLEGRHTSTPRRLPNSPRRRRSYPDREKGTAAGGGDSDADLVVIRRDFPAISHWSDAMLLRQSAGSLARANAELEAKTGRTGRTSLEARLVSNFRDRGTRLSKVAQGEDDQMQRLHEARFLPGPLCNLADVWRRAREVLPEKGLLPYAHYDVASLGLGNQISSKGWTVLHDPGSLDLTLKLFGKGIMALGSTNSEAREGPDSLDAFKLALSAARTG